MKKTEETFDTLCVKLKNRRVCIGRFKGDLGIIFTRLGDRKEGEPRAVRTFLRISWEAATALHSILTRILMEGEKKEDT